MRGEGPTIRSRLVSLVLVATLPMLVFSALLLDHAYRIRAGLVEQNGLGAAERIAAAIDARLGRAEAIGVALAELPSGNAADLAVFEDAAVRALDAAELEAAIDVIDSDGSIVANTLRTGSEPLGSEQDMAAVQRVFATARTVVSGVSVGALSHQPQIAVHVPLIRNGAVRYDISVQLPAGSLSPNALASTLPEQWFVVISDEDDRVIWDTSGRGERAGAPLPPDAAAFFAGRSQGFGTTRFHDGTKILLGFVLSKRTGWRVGVGMPAWVVYGPVTQSIGALGAGGAVVLIASLGLASLIGRSIIRPLGALQRQARQLAAGQTPDRRGTGGIAEAEAAASALYEATVQLRTREAEREAARRRAETSEARLLLAQDVGQIGTWEVNLVTGEQSWSQQLFTLFGRDPALGPPHEVEGLQLLHPDDRESVAAAEARARAEPMTYQLVFRVPQPDGSVRWLRSAARSEFEDGKPVRLIGTTVDTTERLEAERVLRESAARLEAEVAARTEQLAQSEQRFRTYFELSSDALIVMRVEPGPRFVYESLNPSAERLFKLQQDLLAGRTPDDMLSPARAADTVEALTATVSNLGPFTLQRPITVEGETIHVETIFVPVRDPVTNQVTRIISGSRDVTGRQRLESRLAHAQRLEAVGQLTGGVAHDFNNLLTVVIGNLSLLRRRIGDDPRAQRYLASVEAAAERGAKLTSSLLAFSRRQALQVEPIEIGDRITESTTLLRRALGEHVEFSLEIEPGLPPANADAAKLEAAVLNLVINARDAIEEAMETRDERSGTLRVQVHAARLEAIDLEGNDEASPGRFVAVVVEDSGIGMSASVRTRAFEPFFTTKDIGRGTGLGLSQVFGFVRQLGGHVTIDSTPGHGTRVIMFLPEAVREQPAASPLPPEPHPIPPNLTVLVVEDDPSIRDVTAEMLRESGLRVRTAADGLAAMDILRTGERVDLLFTDVVMPGGSTGIDLARTIRELRPGLAVLLTSGYDAPALSRFGGEHDFDVLAKPYTRAALLTRISTVLAETPAD